MEKLRRNGHEALIAGGWVRDFLLGRKARDIDVATSASPREVARLFPDSVSVGASFGVLIVRHWRRSYEVATFRREGPYLDGRHPSRVEYGTLQDDALRRDFTVNALFFDPVKHEVRDLVGGVADLQQRVLRAVGDPFSRFREDHLRMFRAIRFSCALGFEIDADTWRAMQALAPLAASVSAERVRDELRGIFTGPDPARGLEKLSESGLLRVVLPEIEAMKGVEQPQEFHPEGDVWTHTRLAMGLLRRPSAALAFATLLHDVGKPPTFSVRERIRFDGHVELGAEMADSICRRLRFSNEERTAVVDLVLHHLRFMHVREMRESTLKRFLNRPDFVDHLELHRVDCLSSHRDLEYYRFCRERWKQLKREPLPIKQLLGGDDLIEAGYSPGPVFKEILQAVADLQLEGQLKTRDEALDYVRHRFPARGDLKGTPNESV